MLALQIPVCVTLLIVVTWKLHVSKLVVTVAVGTSELETWRTQWVQIDYLGSLTIFLGGGALVTALQLGGNVLPWSHPAVGITAAFGLLGCLLFLVVENKVAIRPIIPIDLWLHRTVGFAILANIFGGMVVYATIFLGPYWFMGVLLLDSHAAGWHYWPSTIAVSSRLQH